MALMEKQPLYDGVELSFYQSIADTQCLFFSSPGYFVSLSSRKADDGSTGTRQEVQLEIDFSEKD